MDRDSRKHRDSLIVRAYGGGDKMAAISATYGVAPQTIRTIVRRSTVPLRPPYRKSSGTAHIHFRIPGDLYDVLRKEINAERVSVSTKIVEWLQETRERRYPQ